jgi:hypothetical protein
MMMKRKEEEVAMAYVKLLLGISLGGSTKNHKDSG